jgi:hypothetical protein
MIIDLPRRFYDEETMDFILQGVSLVSAPYQGRDAVRVTMPASATQDPAKEALSDRDYMAWLDTDFGDGTIEVDLATELAPDAPDYARGFIGLAFRIDRQNRFESIYLRPVNAQVDDPVRRNRSVQYVAYPDFPFPRAWKSRTSTKPMPISRWVGGSRCG